MKLVIVAFAMLVVVGALVIFGADDAAPTPKAEVVLIDTDEATTTTTAPTLEDAAPPAVEADAPPPAAVTPELLPGPYATIPAAGSTPTACLYAIAYADSIIHAGATGTQWTDAYDRFAAACRAGSAQLP